MRAGTPTGRKFHITVGASPSPTDRGAISLHNELALVKAALLYGDQAALCSPTCTLLLSMVMLGHSGSQAGPAEQFRVFRQIAGPLVDESISHAFNVVEALRAKKFRGSRENMELLRLEKQLARTWEEIRDKVSQMANAAGLGELLDAQAAGLLDLYSANDVPGLSADNVTDAVVHDFLARINDAVSGTKSYALLDAVAGSLIRAQIEEDKLTVPDAMKARGRHVALAGDILSRLPHFEAATLPEILDIRRELEDPLIRFRKAMLDYSDRIACAPWDEAFNTETDRVFIREIEPAVLELEEAVKSKSYLQVLLARYAKSPKDFLVPAVSSTVAGPALSLFGADTPTLVMIACAGLGAAHVGVLAWDVRNEMRKVHRPEQNHLFFYYRAAQMLE